MVSSKTHIRRRAGSGRSRPSLQGRATSPDSPFASDERIEAYLLYTEGRSEILSLRSFIEDGGARLKQLLSRLGLGTHPILEGPPRRRSRRSCLETLGFRPAGRHRTLRSDPSTALRVALSIVEGRGRGPNRSVLKNVGDKGLASRPARHSSAIRRSRRHRSHVERPISSLESKRQTWLDSFSAPLADP